MRQVDSRNGAIGDAVVVVLAGYLDGTGDQVADRVVPTMVPERKLEGLATEGSGQNLVAQADTEQRNLVQQLTDRRADVFKRFGVARPV